jgi:hypothetical protein
VRRIVCCLLLSLPLFLFLPLSSHAAEHGVSVGYGFAELNTHTSGGEIEGGKKYDFFPVSYIYENPYWKRVSFVAEPFAAYVNRPNTGVDVGFTLLLRWYPTSMAHRGPFFDVGAGTAYTTIGFKEQGTHFLGILTGGIGYRYKSLFIEDRFKHYSNGHSAYPNRSVNANVVSVGMYF